MPDSKINIIRMKLDDERGWGWDWRKRERVKYKGNYFKRNETKHRTRLKTDQNEARINSEQDEENLYYGRKHSKLRVPYLVEEVWLKWRPSGAETIILGLHSYVLAQRTTMMQTTHLDKRSDNLQNCPRKDCLNTTYPCSDGNTFPTEDELLYTANKQSTHKHDELSGSPTRSIRPEVQLKHQEQSPSSYLWCIWRRLPP